jgi:hypothetical protein
MLSLKQTILRGTGRGSGLHISTCNASWITGRVPGINNEIAVVMLQRELEYPMFYSVGLVRFMIWISSNLSSGLGVVIISEF